MSDLPIDIDIDIDDASETDADTCSNASFRAFSVTDGSSQTSYDASMRSPSPTRSVLSMTSSMRADAFVQEYGRGYNNQTEVYRFPADDEELLRLHKQHLMLREVVGKYPPVLPAIMADDIPGETKACLDIGCGSGGWIMEVATEFPNCSAVAVDLVPLQSIAMPPNCRSEVDDVNLGLEHYYGDFNVVNARLIAVGVKDFQGLIDHISKVLRPGGLISLGEFHLSVHDEFGECITVGTSRIEPPWLPLWMAFVEIAINRRGANPQVASDIVQWVKDHGAFENVVDRAYFIPLWPWAQGDDPEAVRQRHLGELARDDVTAFLKSTRPLLLGSQLPETLVDEIHEGILTEMREAKLRHCIKMQTVYATKKHPVSDPVPVPVPVPATS